MNDMNKKAETKYPVLGLIANRWSPLSFDVKIPEEDQILKLIEAASWAPSSMNEQPWRFKFGIKGVSKNYDLLYDSLIEGNKTWAKTAPVLLLAVAKKQFEYKDRSNNHYAYDLGQAIAYLSLQATEDNLYVHQMGGYDQDKIHKTLGIGPEYETFAVLAIGYLGDPEVLDENNKKRTFSPRKRKPINELIL